VLFGGTGCGLEKGTRVNKITEAPRQRPGQVNRRARWSPGALLTLVNGVMAGIASVYGATRSVTITLAASIAAIVLAGFMMVAKR
jgi:hypothetical protein